MRNDYKMIRICYLILVSLLASSVWAGVPVDRLLNKISFQLNAEQWVTTKSALVNVRVNAAVSDQGIENVQANVLNRLSQIADKTDWHILSLERQLDKSGLENIQIIAQARLDQSALINLRNKAKAISKAGETYTIDSVQFIPSEEEFRAANAALRNNLYQQAKVEIDAINKMYPEQKYYLHQIEFFAVSNAPQPMAIQEIATMNRTAAPPLMVGNKSTLQANVVAAAMPDVVQKLVH